MRRIVFASILAIVLSAGMLAPVLAHAEIGHCTPAVGSSVNQAPAQVVCVMTEEIDTKQSTMSVTDTAGNAVDKKDAHVDLNDPDHKTLIVSLDPAKMRSGVYTVKWHTVTPDDGGVMDGSFQFAVVAVAPAAAATSPAAQATTQPTILSSGAAATPVPILPAPGEQKSTSGWVFGLIGLVLAGGGLAVWRLARRS